MSQGVHPDVEVSDVHAHSLLTHSTLISVPGTSVMIREWDDASTHSQYHAGVYL